MSIPRLTEIFEKMFNSSSEKLKCEVDLNAADIEIGAVEIKNSTDDTRATVGADGLYADIRNIEAGTNVIGKVGIDQTTDGTTNKVQARNSTHDDLNTNANIQVGDADVSSTNAVYITSNSATSSDSQTRPDNTTAYTAGDVVGTDGATNLEFTNVVANSGATAIITGAMLEIDVNAVPSGMNSFRLHLYTSAPTAIADNTAYNLPSGDRTKYAGWIDIDVPTDIGDTIFSRVNNVNFQVAPSTTSLFGLLETRGAYTPSAEDVAKVTLFALEV